MDAQRFSLVEAAFHRAREASGEERERVLAELCGEDEELRREVQELLAAAERPAPRLDRPDLQEMLWEEPRQIGPYRVLSRLGQGGSSVVYLAVEEGEGFSRQVALKMLTGFHGEPILRRFAAEARILAGLEHSGIARFYTAGRSEDGTAYLVLEYVEGTDLLSYCRERHAPLGERLRLFSAVLEAVDSAHRALVVHRDLKPSNILVSVDGTPKLLDFGVAALLDPAEGVAVGETATGLRALTPAYASPEQLRGERVTTATDVYSLGVVLYELLAGVRPHAGSSLSDDLARAFEGGDPEPPSAVAGRRLEGDLDAIVLRTLSHDPAFRYASVSALAEDLRRYGAGLPVSARRPTVRYRAARFLRRHALAAAALSGFVLLAGGGLGWHVTRLQEERDRARAAAEEARREAVRAERMVDLLAAVFNTANPLGQPGRPLSGIELLERGGAKVDRRLAREPELRAQLRVVLGGIWTGLGEYARAATLLEPAAAELERRLGPEHPATAQAWSTLALLRYHQDRHPESRALYERALAVQRTRLGPRHPAVATTLARYGTALHVLGDHKAARTALEEAVTITKATDGPESASVGQFLNDLGTVLQSLGDWDGAARAAERAGAILAREYGPASPVYATAVSNLAKVRARQGRLAEAAELEKKVIEIHQKTFGPSYSREMSHRNTLGWIYLELGRYSEARREFELSLAASKRDKGPVHSNHAFPMRGLAAVEIAVGRPDLARPQVERVLVLRRQIHGPVHWEVATALDDLAEVAKYQKDWRSEEDFLRQSLGICRRVHDAAHPELARAASRLGDALCRHAGPEGSEEGRALLTEAIALREKAAGAQDADLAGWRAARAACGGSGG